jgi:hypothetical protein
MTTQTQQLRDFVKREVRATPGRLIAGTVLTPPKLKDFGAGSSPVWVVDVAIGSNRPLKNVPVKGGANGSRSYADLGQVVLVKEQTGEKFQVIGPGDKKIAVTVVKTYDIGILNPTTTANLGQQVVRRPYSYYRGDLPGTPNSGLYGTPGYPKIETVDGDGNPL